MLLLISTTIFPAASILDFSLSPPLSFQLESPLRRSGNYYVTLRLLWNN